MQRFKDQRVLVTGSGRGIGAAIARRFALEGARVFLTARSHGELAATCDELRSFTTEVEFAALDLTEPDAAAKLANYVEQSWGGLDILVTNAGAAPQGGFLELKDEDWATGFGLKLFANLRVIKGRVANADGYKRPSDHDRWRHGAHARTAPLTGIGCQRRYRGAIQVDCRARASGRHPCQPSPAGHDPDFRRKRLMEKLAAQEGLDYAEYLLQATRRLKIARLGEPGDVAELVAFLATEEARWIHGTIIDVDGGQNKGV